MKRCFQLFITMLLSLQSSCEYLRFFNVNMTQTYLNSSLMLSDPTDIDKSFYLTWNSTTVKIYSTRTLPLPQFSLSFGSSGVMKYATFTRNFTRIYAVRGSVYNIYDYSSQPSMLSSRGSFNPLSSNLKLEIDSRGTMAAYWKQLNATYVVMARVINSSTGQLIQTQRIYFQQNIFQLKFCNSSNTFIVLGNQTLFLAQYISSELIYSISRSFQLGDFTGLTFDVTESCQYFAIAGGDGSIRRLKFTSDMMSFQDLGTIKERTNPATKLKVVQSPLNVGAIYSSGEAGLYNSSSLGNVASSCITINGSCFYNCSSAANSNSTGLRSQCQCNNGYDWINSSCALNCTDQYSGGVFTIALQCPCINSYYWDTVANQCTINCQKITNTNGSSGRSSCFCVQNYNWAHSQCVLIDCSNLNAVLISGKCSCPTGYINISNYCMSMINCSNLENTLGNNGPNSCLCIPEFLWNSSSASCRINCPIILNTIGQFGTKDCSCRSYYVWNPISMTCQINCSNFAYTNGSFGDSTCFCSPKNRTWSKSYQECVINCSVVNAYERDGICICSTGYMFLEEVCSINCALISNTLGNNGSNSCFCITTNYYWNNTLLNCKINCSLIPQSNGSSGSDNCFCNSDYSWSSSQKVCMINCSQKPHAITNISPLACYCRSPYIWNSNERICEIFCDNISFTSRNYNANQCVCIYGYYWQANTLQCWLQCSLFNNAISISQPYSCGCLYKNMTWANQQCIWNCSAVNADIIDGLCTCRFNYTFAQEFCLLNCSLFKYTYGNNGLNRCLCNSGFIWNEASFFCQINCSSIPNTAGTAGEDSCICISGYSWRNFKCELNCSSKNAILDSNICKCPQNYIQVQGICRRNCSAIPSSAGQNGWNDCFCQTGYNWNGILCILNCAAIPNTNGNSGTYSCNCVTDYTWSSGSCVIETTEDSSTSAVAIAVGVAVPLGIIALGGAIGGYIYWRKRRLRRAQYDSGPLARSMSSSPLNNYNSGPSAAILNFSQANNFPPMNFVASQASYPQNNLPVNFGIIPQSYAAPVNYGPVANILVAPAPIFSVPRPQTQARMISGNSAMARQPVIETNIPIFKIPTATNLDNLCSICLMSGTNAKTSCNHMFHIDCISIWLRKDRSCPNCRAANITFTVTSS